MHYLDDQGVAQIVQDQASYSQEQTVSEPTQEQVVPKEATRETEKEHNLRYLRERAEAAERRAQELERAIQLNMTQQQGNKIEIEEDDIDVSDDMYIEGKQFKKYVKNMQKELKSTRKQLEEFNQKSSLANAEVRLKSQFTDFDSVVTKENLEKLSLSKPSLYRSIMASQDIYDRGYTAYEMIKASGVLVDPYEEQNRRIEENKGKPRASANLAPQTAETPLTRVGDYDRRILTNERKDQLLRQVELAKQYRQ